MLDVGMIWDSADRVSLKRVILTNRYLAKVVIGDAILTGDYVWDGGSLQS